MKQSVFSLIAVLCLSAMMYAGDENKQVPMSGTVCNSKCVVSQSNTPTCDLSCTDKSGDCVLVEDSGKVTKIENSEMAMPHMGKRVKVMVTPTEKEREKMLRLSEIRNF